MQTEKIVYFVRHGQSADNVAPVFQSPDSPLTEKGREQAERIAERISRLSFDALISSTFQRAKETADAIKRITGKEIIYSELFVERMKPSSVNGKSYDNKEAAALWEKWEESLYTSATRAEDGENFDDIITRADKALSFLRERPESSIVVVTHGYFLRTMIARALIGDLLTGEIFRRFQQGASTENTGLSVLKYQGNSKEEMRWRLWIYNDHAHLG